MSAKPVVRLYVDESEVSGEAVAIVTRLGLEYMKVPANGHSIPTLVHGDREYPGLAAIRMFADSCQMLRD